MEGGLHASFEKMVLDADLLGMVTEFLNPLKVNEGTLALDAIREVGPGGHYFGAAHTKARYRNAFFAPMVSDWRNYETWEEAGSPTAYDRTNAIYKDKLENYHQPEMDQSAYDALVEFIAKRKEQGGVETDF